MDSICHGELKKKYLLVKGVEIMKEIRMKIFFSAYLTVSFRTLPYVLPNTTIVLPDITYYMSVLLLFPAQI